MRNSKIKKKSMKKCVVDIRYHAAVGDYGWYLLVLLALLCFWLISPGTEVAFVYSAF